MRTAPPVHVATQQIPVKGRDPLTLDALSLSLPGWRHTALQPPPNVLIGPGKGKEGFTANDDSSVDDLVESRGNSGLRNDSDVPVV